MKRLILICCFFIPLSACCQESDTLKNMLIITCHPDDWEIGMGGTAYLLKDKYHIHIIITSDGELGNTWNTTGKPDPELAAHRVEDSMKSEKIINATSHFFKLRDGDVYADEDAVDRTIKLLKDINPSIIFLHWPIDKADHAAASAMAIMALAKAGMINNREVYFFEVGKLNHFTPDIYVDISSVWDNKMEVVQFHERYNDDRFQKMTEESGIYHGRSNHCKYAEGFKTFYPITNVRWNKRIEISLLNLDKE